MTILSRQGAGALDARLIMLALPPEQANEALSGAAFGLFGCGLPAAETADAEEDRQHGSRRGDELPEWIADKKASGGPGAGMGRMALLVAVRSRRRDPQACEEKEDHTAHGCPPDAGNAGDCGCMIRADMWLGTARRQPASASGCRSGF